MAARWAARRPEVTLYEAEDGGVLAIASNDARFGHPVTDDAAESLARATAELPIVHAWGAARAVRSLVAARQDTEDWHLTFSGSEMARTAPHTPRVVTGELRRASDFRGRHRGGAELPPPLEAWMSAFIEEEFDDGARPPPVSAEELWVWIADGEPRTMAAALVRGADAIRIVTVYTPPEALGFGYAGALVTAMAADALANGRRYITLDVCCRECAGAARLVR